MDTNKIYITESVKKTKIFVFLPLKLSSSLISRSTFFGFGNLQLSPGASEALLAVQGYSLDMNRKPNVKWPEAP